jgi:tetrahydromethanopterin:alpha-L-glutamate ligase
VTNFGIGALAPDPEKRERFSDKIMRQNNLRMALGISPKRSPSGAVAAEPAPRRPLVALVCDGLDWHARNLIKAFAAHGADAAPIRLPLCAFDSADGTGLRLDGLGDRLPDAVMVRTMSGGTFEAVTLRLGLLHALRELGVMVCNDARAIERCVDKSMTSFLLARAGIPTPATWATESVEAARAIVRREAAQGALVLKPLFGSQGRGLRLIRCEDDLPDPSQMAGVYYMQRFVAVENNGYRDFRLLVSQGRVIAAMARHSASWITNVKRGGKPVAVVADGAMTEMAVRAVGAVGAAFAGVDLLYGADGRPTVLEINSNPAWFGLQQVVPASIAGILAADLVAALKARAAQEAQG